MTKSWDARLCRLPQARTFCCSGTYKQSKIKCCGIKDYNKNKFNMTVESDTYKGINNYEKNYFTVDCYHNIIYFFCSIYKGPGKRIEQSE